MNKTNKNKHNRLKSLCALILILSLVLLSFIFLLSALKEDKVISSENYSSPIKLAYALYDAPYTHEDYLWINNHASLVVAFENDYQNLKNLDPEILMLLYKFAGITDEDKVGHSVAGFTYISNNHGDWFLKTKERNRVYDDYNEYSRTHSFFLDYGNLKWTQYAAKDYVDSLSNKKWDGIFLDVIYLDIDQYKPQDLDYDRILYEISVENHLRHVKNELNKIGKLLVINGASLINHRPIDEWGGRNINNMWEEAYKITDGIAEEAFVNYFHWYPQLIWQPKDRWELQIKALEQSKEYEDIYIAVSHNRGLNRQDTVYNTVSYLLGMHEKSYFFNLGLRGYRLENYKVDYEEFRDIYEVPLGQPLGKRYLERGQWKRKFENGVVSLNFNTKSAQIKLNNGVVIK